MLFKITDAAKHLGIHPDTLRFSICSHVGCEVVVVNASEDSSYEEDLTRDVLEIITVFFGEIVQLKIP